MGGLKMENKKYSDLLESYMNDTNDVNYKNNHVSTSCKKKKEKKNTKHILKKIGNIILNLYFVFSIVLGLYTGLAKQFPEKAYKLTTTIESVFNKQNETQTHDWSVENNIGTLYNIQPEIWDTLTDDQKINTIDNLKNIELYYLGVSTPTKLIVKNIGNNIAGQHISILNIIEIDKNHLLNDSVYDVVNTICHECRHAFQNACVNAYENADDEYKNLIIFNNSRQFEDNYANYYEFNGFNETYDEYASQTIEADAFEYAEQATNDYYSNLIPKYVEMA